MISEHLTSWLGYPVTPLSFENIGGQLPDLSKTICRLHIGWDDEGSFAELFARFLKLPGVERSPGVIIGAFFGDETDAESKDAVTLLVAARTQLTSLKGIFLGDIISEENEISWINQSDVSPLFSAYPHLEHFAVRGGTGLTLGQINHEHLKSLVIETGGLPSSVLTQVSNARLPNLEHLELWLGTDQYGWDGSIADVQPLMEASLFPKLRYLGLKNSDIQDDIATHIVGSTVIRQLDTLDMSMGVLTDTGGEALLACSELIRLKKLDLHYHYLSPAMENELRNAFPNADLSERQTADEYGDEVYRNVAVSE